MTLIPVEEKPKGRLVPVNQELKLTGNTVNMDTFEGGGEFSVASPEQKFQWANDGKIGWWEYGKRTLFSDLYYGQILGVGSLKGLADRLQEDKYATEEAKQSDMEKLKEVMLFKEELQTRGLSWGGQVYRITAQIPTFAMEFALTSGLASVTRKAVTKAGTQVVKEAAKKTLIRKGVEVLGREAVVGAVRTTVMPHRYIAGYAERRLNDSLAITDKGIEILEDIEEKPITSFLKAYGDCFVEYYTETLGGELLKPIGRVAGKGILSRMPEGVRASFVKTAEALKKVIPEGRMMDILQKGGWNGLIEEYGEERLGALLRIPLGLDEREMTTMDKLQEGVFPGWEQSMIEIGAFSLWGGAGASTQVISNYLANKGRSQADIDKILHNLSQSEKDDFAAKIGETFDERVRGARIVIDAAAGAELTENEKATLETIYDEFVTEGLIKPKEVEEKLGKETKPLIEEVKTETEQKATQILEANEKQRADVEKKIDLLYQGREKQLDQRRLAIEREMLLLEQQKAERRKQDLPIQEIDNRLEKLGKELESIHYQIADLEETAIERLEKEGITIKGEELERLRQRAFRQGEIALRKDLLAQIKAKQQEKARRAKAIKGILKQPKKPEGIIDVKYQNKINDILSKLGPRKQVRKKALNKMTTPELEQLANDIASLKETGKKIFASKKAQKKMAAEILRGALIKEAGGVPQEKLAKGSLEEKKAKRAKALKKADIDFLRPLRMIRILFGNLGERLIYDPIDYATMIKGIFSLSRKKAIDGAMKKHKVSLFDLGSSVVMGKGKPPRRVPKGEEGLLQEAKQFKTAEEFIRANRQSHLMDLSSPEKHWLGRAIPSYPDEPFTDIAQIIEDKDRPGSYLSTMKYSNPVEYRAISSPKDTITIYRAVPSNIGDEIRIGDYVALDKKYAQMHLESVVEGQQGVKGKIISKTVPKKDIVWGEADFTEWAYSPKELRDKYISLTDIWNKAQEAEPTTITPQNIEPPSVKLLTGPTMGETLTINGKTFQVNNILRMYLALKDKKSYEALLFGNNLTPEEVNAFVDTVKKEMPSYITFADEVQKIVAERYQQIAEIMAEYFNVNVEKIKEYFPLRRMALGTTQEELNQDIESEIVFEQALRKGEGFTYTSTDKGFTISRKDIDEKFQTEISLDFMGDAYRAIDKQEHLIAFAPLHKAFNKILNDQVLQAAVKYNHSEEAWKWLNQYLLFNINPDLMYQGGNQIGGFINRLLGKGRRGLTRAYLGFNVVTAGKQLPSLELALKYTTQKDLTISMERILLSKEARDKVYELDPSLKNRVISRDIDDVIKLITSFPESDLKRQLLIMSQKLDKKAFAMIMQMDKFAVLSVYDAVYRHQLKTKSEAEAKDIAHKAVIETQPQGGVKDLPRIYTTNNEFIRMALLFSNQLNQIWNMVRADMPAEIKQKQYGRAVTGLASIMISSSLIYILSHGRLPEDWDDFIDAIFGNTIASIPVLGQWGMSMMRGYEPSISPAQSILNNIKWMISNIRNEEYGKAFQKSLFLLAIWLELPYAQFKRTFDGIYDLVTEETEDFRRLIWSEFSLENQ